MKKFLEGIKSLPTNVKIFLVVFFTLGTLGLIKTLAPIFFATWFW
jgi:hypothetical protein